VRRIEEGGKNGKGAEDAEKAKKAEGEGEASREMRKRQRAKGGERIDAAEAEDNFCVNPTQ